MAKISIKLAAKYHTDFDLSGTHLTTSDFGQIQVSQFMEVLPTDKIHASVFSEARCAPMVVPTFMDCKMYHRSFFVPLSAIFQPFEYFYTDKQDASVLKQLPYTTNQYLVQFMASSTYGLTRQFSKGVVKPDFSDANYDYQLTEKGRLFYKLLLSLGYSINWSTADTSRLSLLPLLAYARVAYDYIYPSQYLDGLALTKYFKVCTASELSTLFGTTAVYGFLDDVCTLLTMPYRQDYFTASWQSLNAPGTSVQSIAWTAPDTSVVNSSQNAVAVDSSNGPLSRYALQGLQQLYDFVTRRNIVGTRFADQIFGIFGIGSRKSDPDMSQFIGQTIQPVRVVDVTAMTSAENQELGELAGKAFINGSGKLFDFDSADEFGYIMTLSFIMPEIGYYQGRKRSSYRLNRFDWLHPEFDMQMRAIRNDELFADFKDSAAFTSAANYGGTPDNRFSFAPNYSELKKGEHYITGDFRNNSLNTGLQSYWLMRDIPTPSSAHPLALNSQFLFMQQHEFDKIFAQQYTLRLPLTLLDNHHGQLVCYNGVPMIFVTPTVNSVYDVFVMLVDNDGNLFFRSARSDDDATNLKVQFGIDLADPSTYYKLTTLSSTGFCEWSFFGTTYRIADSNSVVSSSTVVGWYDLYYLRIGTKVVGDYDTFITPYRDYIDHFYICHRFDIKANRPLAPISEEFMIEDGGNKVSVDMSGNRIV